MELTELTFQRKTQHMPHFRSAVLLNALTLVGPSARLGISAQAAAPVLVVNKGIGGHTSKNGLARFERDVVEVKPDHLILYFGINDACNSGKLVPLPDFNRSMQAMIDRAGQIGVKSVVLVTLNPVVPEYLLERHRTHPHRDGIKEHVAKYDTAVRELARQNELPIADLSGMIEEHGGATLKLHSLVRNEANSKSRDGVHLTEQGYRLMAELFEPIFRGRIEPGQVVVCLGDSLTYGAHVDGAGTAFGSTYPAWLWLVLNRLAGTTERKTPLPPPRVDPKVLVRNGNFEESADRVHPDHWRIWNVSGRQEGRMKLATDADTAHAGRRHLVVTNDNPAAPACLNCIARAKVAQGSRYQLVYWVRGKGAILPAILQYAKRKYRSAVGPKSPIAATDEWQRQTLEYEPDEGVTEISLRFRVTGEVWLDSMSLREPGAAR